MKGPGGVPGWKVWRMVKVYALTVSQRYGLLDKFNSHCLQLEYQSLKEVETNPKKPN
jgi:hypothetical protein